MARSKSLQTVWRPEAPYSQSSLPSPIVGRNRSQNHANGDLPRNDSVSPSLAPDSPDAHTGSRAGTTASLYKGARPGHSTNDAVLDTAPQLRVNGNVSNSPLWTVPSTVTAGVASQLLDGLEQPQKAFGNAHTPLWASPREGHDSIASDTDDGDDTESFHESTDPTDPYALVDVANITTTDIGTVDSW